jgi:hypothetical protein
MAGLEEVARMIGFWCWVVICFIVLLPLSIWYCVRLGTYAYYQARDRYFKDKKKEEQSDG